MIECLHPIRRLHHFDVFGADVCLARFRVRHDLQACLADQPAEVLWVDLHQQDVSLFYPLLGQRDEHGPLVANDRKDVQLNLLSQIELIQTLPGQGRLGSDQQFGQVVLDLESIHEAGLSPALGQETPADEGHIEDAD